MKDTKKLPDGCALCNRFYNKNHVCTEEPYTATKLKVLAFKRKHGKSRRKAKK